MTRPTTKASNPTLPARIEREFIPATVPEAKRALAKLERDIDSESTYAAIRLIERRAAAIKKLFAELDDVRQQAERVILLANHRIGTELRAAPVATGTRGQLTGRDASGAPRRDAPESPPSLKDRVGSQKRGLRLTQLAAIPRPDLMRVAADLQAEDREATVTAVLAGHRRRLKREHQHAVATAAFSADGPFGTVVIDPPWPMQKIDRDVRPNQHAFDYPTMSVEEIEAFWKREMASRICDDCHLFLWTTQKYLPAALNLIERIEFHYVLTMVWLKPGGFQPIDLPQYNIEFVIYARRGSPVFIDLKDFNCGFTAPRREHSRKPDEFYNTILRVTGGSRIDVFSREPREGFAQYGNEITRFTDYDPIDDINKSVAEGFRVIRERKSAGGPGWPKDAAE